MKFYNKMVERLFPPITPIEPGVYHYQAPPDAEFPYRLHLRVESSGESTLIVNASTVLHLNQTASEYAYHLVQQTAKDDVIRQMRKRYNAPAEQVRKDFEDLVDRLHVLVDTPDLDPITFLDFERSDPYSGEITAPYRLDCALTYRVADAEAGEAAPLDRVDRELSSDEWKVILDKAWDAGIPHIIFTGGEPTLRSDLADLITHAEQLGQVTGVLTNGLRLAEKDYLQQLLQSGLDHLMVIFDTNEEQAWEALRDVMAEDIFATVHLTITKIDTEEIVGALQRMKELGVESLSLSAMDADLNSTLQEIREAAADMQFSLVWDVPVPYSSFNPVSLEMSGEGEKVRGAGKAWLYVEPDGDVLEAQGKPKVSGNLLTNTWSEIWDKVLSDMQKHEA